MNFFKAKETRYFKNKIFGEGSLLPGETYFAYTQFAEETVNQGFGEIISIEDPPFAIIEPEFLHKQGLASKKILLFFAGGFGDAVMIGMVLPFITERLGVEFDLCCSREKWQEIFRPLNIKGAWISYPPTVNTLRSYDGVITDITRFFTNEGNKVSSILQVCRGVGLDPKELPKAAYQLDEESITKTRLPDPSKTRIAVNLDSNGSVKSYPPALHHEILKRLKSFGLEIFLLGHRHPDHPSISDDLAVDLRDKTSIKDLAALIYQMDLVIGMDSFICHMANVLEIPTLVLLSTTSPGFFSFHSHITCISSKLTCSPCYSVFDACPQGRDECTAFYDQSIAPSAIATTALEHLINSFKKKIKVNSGHISIRCPENRAI
jgi:hypothetical protein